MEDSSIHNKGWIHHKLKEDFLGCQRYQYYSLKCSSLFSNILKDYPSLYFVVRKRLMTSLGQLHTNTNKNINSWYEALQHSFSLQRNLILNWDENTTKLRQPDTWAFEYRKADLINQNYSRQMLWYELPKERICDKKQLKPLYEIIIIKKMNLVLKFQEAEFYWQLYELQQEPQCLETQPNQHLFAALYNIK